MVILGVLGFLIVLRMLRQRQAIAFNTDSCHLRGVAQALPALRRCILTGVVHRRVHSGQDTACCCAQIRVGQRRVVARHVGVGQAHKASQVTLMRLEVRVLVQLELVLAVGLNLPTARHQRIVQRLIVDRPAELLAQRICIKRTGGNVLIQVVDAVDVGQ